MIVLIFLYNYNNYKHQPLPLLHCSDVFIITNLSNWVRMFCRYFVCCLLRFNNNVLYQDDLQFSYRDLCHILLSSKRWSFYQGSYLSLYKRFILISQHRLRALKLNYSHQLQISHWKHLSWNAIMNSLSFCDERRMNFFPVTEMLVHVPALAIWETETNENNLHTIWL